MAAWVFDIIAVLLIVTTIIISAKKGFLSGLLSFAGWLISVFVAKTFCTVSANFVYNALLKNRIYTAVFSALEQHGGDLSSSYTEFIESLPETIQKLLESADIDALGSILSDSGKSLESIATRVSEDVVGPLVLTLLTALAFIIIFVVTLLVLKLLARIFKGVKKIPLIGPINTFLGGVTGAIEAVIIIYILKIVIEFATTASGGNLFGLTLDDFSNSYVFHFFKF